MDTEHIWLAVGFIGQALFFSRFLVQWIVSERQGQSVIPNVFWYLSIGGGIFLLAYSLWRQDPVFISGQAVGILVYARNLYFIHRAPPAVTGDIAISPAAPRGTF